MATAAGEVFKEFHALARNIDKLTDGQAQVELEDSPGDESEDTITFLVSVCPNAGYYKGAEIKFRVHVTSEYPSDAPVVECLNSVYHPNIDVQECGQPTSICVSLLGDDWQPEVGLDGCIISILFLFHHPNLDDALSHVFSGNELELEGDEYAENVRKSLKGEEVEGHFFDKLLAEDCSNDNNHENVPEVNENVAPLVTPTQCEKDVLVESDGTDHQAEKLTLDEEAKEGAALTLPLFDNKILLKDTRPLEINSYNWGKIAFSFCHLFKRLYHRVLYNHRTDDANQMKNHP